MALNPSNNNNLQQLAFKGLRSFPDLEWSEHGVMRFVKIRCTPVDVLRLMTLADVCSHTIHDVILAACPY